MFLLRNALFISVFILPIGTFAAPKPNNASLARELGTEFGQLLRVTLENSLSQESHGYRTPDTAGWNQPRMNQILEQLESLFPYGKKDNSTMSQSFRNKVMFPIFLLNVIPAMFGPAMLGAAISSSHHHDVFSGLGPAVFFAGVLWMFKIVEIQNRFPTIDKIAFAPTYAAVWLYWWRKKRSDKDFPLRYRRVFLSAAEESLGRALPEVARDAILAPVSNSTELPSTVVCNALLASRIRIALDNEPDREQEEDGLPEPQITRHKL